MRNRGRRGVETEQHTGGQNYTDCISLQQLLQFNTVNSCTPASLPYQTDNVFTCAIEQNTEDAEEWLTSWWRIGQSQEITKKKFKSMHPHVQEVFTRLMMPRMVISVSIWLSTNVYCFPVPPRFVSLFHKERKQLFQLLLVRLLCRACVLLVRWVMGKPIMFSWDN